MRPVAILALLGCTVMALSGCERLMAGHSFTAVPYVAGGQPPLTT